MVKKDIFIYYLVVIIYMVDIQALMEERKQMDALIINSRNDYRTAKSAIETYNNMKQYTMFD